MKILVAYYTKTGNTKKVAEGIYQALDKNDKELKTMKEVEDTEGYDLIFCGFPVHAHSVPVSAQNFLKKIPPSAKVALFSTHGSQREGQMPKEAIHNAIGLVKGEVLGSFTCRGEVEQEIIDGLVNRPEHRAWAMEARSAQSHPDSADLDDAQFFAKNMVRRAVGFTDFARK
ncbi:MAG: flavodoxin family protein [Desulfomonilia bacterium]|nr:flavodoxin family protein [Deltaproteobacteria bacterium]MDX9760598.1 flavodoxin family protein [Desulfomonilia bacterium]HPW68816.1 flavodoxin family protein [Deltaproteobacteria bacterium]